MKQSLFHLGVIDSSSFPLKWRLDQTTEGWATFRTELDSLADEMQHKTRNHRAMNLLTQLAAYASQFDPKTRATCRKLCEIVTGWGDSKLKEAGNDDKYLATLRSQACVFYQYGVLCHGSGELKKEDVQSLCLSMVDT